MTLWTCPEALIKARKRAQKLAPKVRHGEHAMHCAYLAFVFLEGHGLYSYSAGGLLGFVVIHMCIGDSDA